jgi:hypothetical protein
MKPKEITVQFVEARARALQKRWSDRNSRMDDYERLYLLDMWDDAPEPDERRIAGPRAWSTVESFRTLLLTRPPVLSVPPSEVQAVAVDQADRIEKYLYGCWYQARVMDALNLAEWFACALGEGVLRVVYDDTAVEDELPLVVQALDPRTVYLNPSGRAGIDLEAAHVFDRPRREIEQEWGVELERTGREAGEGLEDWLDGEVEYVEYWRVDVEEVEEEIEEQPEQEPAGVLARLVAMARRVREGLGMPGPEGEAAAGPGLVAAGEIEGETGKRTRRVRRVRRRHVTHCVVVEGQFVKQPVRVPGYHRLPFVRYPGIATPLQDEDGSLSVLFPVAGGTRQNGAVGLIAAENELLAMRQRIVEMYANGALITDDDDLMLDLTPGAVNRIRRGAQWSFLTPPGPHPSVDGQLQLVEKLMEDATISAAMQGRYSGTMSGLAISAITNPVLMRIAHRQQIRERAYETVNEMLLQLTEEYAPAEGWYVWGVNRVGGVLELRVGPDDIGGYYRNRVELSASLPKDDAGEIMSLAQLVGQSLISRETFLDQLQRIKMLSSQSPQDEMKKILRDKLLFEGDTSQRLAQVVLSEFSQELAEALQQPQPQQQPGPMPPGGPGAMPPGAGPGGPPMGGPPMGPGGPPMMGPGPMGGMPPGVIPPGAVPPALAPEEMMAMLGNPMPGPARPGGGR